MIEPVVFTRIPASDPTLVAEAATYGVADLHEALGPVGGRMLLMSPRMRPLDPAPRIAGPAVTAYNYPGDNLMIHQALYLAAPGQVLVFTNGGGRQGALWGELAAYHAQQKGVAAVVVDGAVRDTAALTALRFPTWATAISPEHPEKRGPGAVNVPIVCDGVLVNPGDIIVGDADGVLVVPLEHLPRAVAGARERTTKEHRIKERLDAGASLFELFNIAKAVEASGAKVHDTTWQDRAAGTPGQA